ncbi:Vacuolar protein sorting-associated protein 54 [Spathaspora sp. JA1]|nr:Vacuolar protein sorting-associated protein 54 [Spathaspora sp. JA1]
MTERESLSLPRVSLDDSSSINLNDDLAVATSDQSSITNNTNNNNTGHNTTRVRFRTSVDNDSIFSSSVHGFNADETRDDVYSPLGPNSIYELTIGSDVARIKRNKPLKTSVTINGGANTVYNLTTPTTRDIPQIQLSKLKAKVPDSELIDLVKNSEVEYKRFDSSYKLLTEDTLQKLEQQQVVDSIDSIPSVFLDSNFRLDDPRIFKQVIQDVSDYKLQDKLSNYLDIVEMNLIQEIGKSSDSFFNTIGDIEKIQIKSKNCVDVFDSINSELKLLQSTQSRQGLKILHKLIERQNVETFQSALLQIQCITLRFDQANNAFTSGDYSKSLSEIVVVEKLLSGVSDEEYPELSNLVDLTQLPAFIHLRNDLSSLKLECCKGYTDDFIKLLTEDLTNHYTSVDTEDTLNRLYIQQDKTKKYSTNPINTSYLTIDNSTKTKLREFVENLQKADKLSQAYIAYQHRFITEIKDIIKQNLPQQSADMSRTPSRASPGPDKPPPTLSNNIKTLTPREFETMFSKTCAELSECLRRLTIHQKLLLDLALTNTTTDIMSLDITPAIHKAIELTQIRLMKVCSVRSEQTGDLPVSFYLRLYSITSCYLYECELINPMGNSGNALGEWFNNHLTYFVHRFHVNSVKEMSGECTKEIWREVSDSGDLTGGQSVVDELLGYVNGDDWSKYFDFYQVEQQSEQKQSVEAIKRLTITNDQFLVPNLALKTIQHIRDYIVISKAFPNFIGTITNNLLNYLKLLNSKTSQAVLNAGATRTAGLKHITTKHLALCIQFIEFNIALLESIKVFFPSDPQIETNLEDLTYSRILGNYKDHETELFSKLVTMMHDRTLMRCGNLPKINWSEPLKHPQQCHSYMEDLVKDTITVAKVLTKYLPDLKSSLILSQIFDNYKRLFVDSYCNQLPPFRDLNEKQNVLKDVDYFRVKLCDVAGYGMSGQVIWENVNAMPTEEETKMEEKMRNNIEMEQQQQQVQQQPKATRTFSFDRLVSSARNSFDRHHDSVEPRSQSATGNLQENKLKSEEEEQGQEGEEEGQTNGIDVIFDVTETSVEPEVVPKDNEQGGEVEVDEKEENAEKDASIDQILEKESSGLEINEQGDKSEEEIKPEEQLETVEEVKPETIPEETEPEQKLGAAEDVKPETEQVQSEQTTEQNVKSEVQSEEQLENLDSEKEVPEKADKNDTPKVNQDHENNVRDTEIENEVSVEHQDEAQDEKESITEKELPSTPEEDTVDPEMKLDEEVKSKDIIETDNQVESSKEEVKQEQNTQPPVDISDDTKASVDTPNVILDKPEEINHQTEQIQVERRRKGRTGASS